MPTNLIPINYSVSGDIITPNIDLLKVEIPNPTEVSIVKVSVNSFAAATDSEKIEVRNAANGGGSGIVVEFDASADSYFAFNSGSLSLTDYLWIRSGSIVGTLGDINVTIRYRPS